MAQNMLLSVVVPVFNTPERYLREMFSCLIDGLPDRAEIVIVDDGSQQTTAAVLDEFAAQSGSVTVIHQPNGGQNAARMSGVLHARGIYVAFCDADDILRWDRMNRILQILAPCGVDVVAYNCNILDGAGGEALGYGFTQFPDELFGGDNKRLVLAQCAEVWRNIIRRSLLTPDIFACNSNVGEDLAAVFLAISRANTIEVCNDAPYLYRMNPDGAESTADAHRRSRILDVFDFILLNLDRQAKERYQQELEWQAIWHILYVESAAMLKNFDENAGYIRMLCAWVDERFPDWEENRYLGYLKKHEGIRFRLIVGRRYKRYLVLHRSMAKWRTFRTFVNKI